MGSRWILIIAWIFTLASFGLAAYALSRQWAPHFDFDILGVAWLLTNSPNLFLIVLAITFGVMALRLWYLYVRARL